MLSHKYNPDLQMEQKQLIIKVSNERVWLNPKVSILIDQTNIPKDHLTFRSHGDIYWKVEMLGFSGDTKCLEVRVKEYSPQDTSNFHSQRPKKEVAQLRFEKFDWEKLEPELTSYQKIKLREVLFNIDANPFSKGDAHPFKSNKIDSTSIELNDPIEKQGFITINEDFWHYFKDAHFKLGYVSFKKYIDRLDREIEFSIANDHILPEFDNIKFWFAKKLKKKKFKVNAVIKLSDDGNTETLATSRHIDQITPDLIDGVKYQRTFALTKELRMTEPDKSLFTAEEIFSQIDTDDMEGNVFKQSEEDILEFLMENKNIRNKKQLAYLAGKKQSERHKLQFTLSPNFGFLFLVEGEKNNHFIWELLNSHATYIWSVEKHRKNIDQQYKRIESIINTVRTSGRENYKRAYRNDHQDHDLVFRLINHEDISSKLVDGFPRWRSKLNEQLI